MIRYIKALVDSDDDVHVDDDYLDCEVEDVEARLGMIPCGSGNRTLSTDVVRPSPETRTETNQEGCDEEEGDFRPESAMAEFLNARSAREGESAKDDDEGEKGDYGVKCLAIEFNVAIDARGVGIEGIERLNNGGEEHS